MKSYLPIIVLSLALLIGGIIHERMSRPPTTVTVNGQTCYVALKGNEVFIRGGFADTVWPRTLYKENGRVMSIHRAVTPNFTPLSWKQEATPDEEAVYNRFF